MTNPQDPEQDPTIGLLSILDGAASRVRRAAFTRLLATAEPVDVTTLAFDTGLAKSDVETALADLASAGAITRQPSSAGQGSPAGPVVAAGGLSVAPARHQLLLDGRAFWTWCAFDGIGIPAALGIDAVLETRCPTCGEHIQVSVVDGQPPLDSPVVGWLPGRACANVQDDFCPEANLFCSDAHLASWRATVGEPLGTAASLPDLAETGRQVWSDLTSPAE
ncbi:MAG TPA: organomercurial lyase [Nocardioidaceae bacterium]|nr:organomercurial lyase [Nocardioidaceae bacterium]